MSKSFRSSSLWAAVAAASLALNGWFYFNRAGVPNQQSTIINHQSEVFVCPMHPQVVSDHSADCPICGMKLVKKSDAASDPELDSLIGSVNLSPTQEALANVKVEHPVYMTFQGSTATVGRVALKEAGLWKATVRVMGRIDRLYVSTPGDPVQAGDPLFDLYSPDLTAAGAELIRVLAAGTDDPERVIAARSKLLALGLEPERLQEIEAADEPPDVFTFTAGRAGVLMEKMASEGDWTMPGMALIDFADLAEVWIEGSLLERDAAKLAPGDAVEVHLPDGTSAVAGVELVGPMVDMMTRTLPFKASLPNPGGKLKPGMFLRLTLRNGNSFQALSLPEEAVLRTGRETIVWLLAGAGRYIPRAVLIGSSQEGRTAILAGLETTDAVAVNGAYLIDSDARMRRISSGEHDSRLAPPPVAKENEADAPYFCPMHPEITSDKPDDRCSLCGMFLEKRETSR